MRERERERERKRESERAGICVQFTLGQIVYSVQFLSVKERERENK